MARSSKDKAQVVAMVAPMPKSKEYIIEALRDLLEKAHKQEIDYLEVIYKVDGIEHNNHYIGTVYTARGQ